MAIDMTKHTLIHAVMIVIIMILINKNNNEYVC